MSYTMPSGGTAATSAMGLAAPPAAWYPDNADPRLQRWWDGQQWTEHVAPLPVVAPVAIAPQPAAYAPNPTYGYTVPAAAIRPESFDNTISTRGLTFSLIGIVVNPFLLVSIAGIVMGIIGLVRASGFAPQQARRGAAIGAIAVSVVVMAGYIGAAAYVYNLQHPATSSGIGTIAQPHAQPSTPAGFDHVALERAISLNLMREGMDAVVTCPSDVAFVPSARFDCSATMADGQSKYVHVSVYTTGNGYSFSIDSTPAA